MEEYWPRLRFAGSELSGPWWPRCGRSCHLNVYVIAVRYSSIENVKIERGNNKWQIQYPKDAASAEKTLTRAELEYSLVFSSLERFENAIHSNNYYLAAQLSPPNIWKNIYSLVQPLQLVLSTMLTQNTSEQMRCTVKKKKASCSETHESKIKNVEED